MSRRIDLTPAARLALGDLDEQQLYVRARDMSVLVYVGRSYRRACWKVTVTQGPNHTELYGKGPLAAVIAGALDDFESQVAA